MDGGEVLGGAGDPARHGAVPISLRPADAPEHGRRLADLLPHGHLVEIADSYTLIPEDQPAILTAHVREFVTQAQPPA